MPPACCTAGSQQKSQQQCLAERKAVRMVLYPNWVVCKNSEFCRMKVLLGDRNEYCREGLWGGVLVRKEEGHEVREPLSEPGYSL